MSKLHCWLGAIERVLLALWVGGMCGVGYVAVPSLFANLDDRQVAGNLAAPMFKIIAIAGLVVVALLLAARAWRGAVQNWRTVVLIVAGIAVTVGLFVLQPQMAALKLQGIAPGTDQARQFGMLHGVSSVLYLVTTILGMVLIAAGSGCHGAKKPLVG